MERHSAPRRGPLGHRSTDSAEGTVAPLRDLYGRGEHVVHLYHFTISTYAALASGYLCSGCCGLRVDRGSSALTGGSQAPRVACVPEPDRNPVSSGCRYTSHTACSRARARISFRGNSPSVHDSLGEGGTLQQLNLTIPLHSFSNAAHGVRPALLAPAEAAILALSLLRLPRLAHVVAP